MYIYIYSAVLYVPVWLAARGNLHLNSFDIQYPVHMVILVAITSRYRMSAVCSTHGSIPGKCLLSSIHHVQKYIYIYIYVYMYLYIYICVFRYIKIWRERVRVVLR